MAVTVEELEIKVTAQVQQALAGLDKVLAKLQQIASTAMPQVEKTAKATAAAVDKTSRAMGLNAKAAQNAQKSAAAAGGATERAFAAAQKRLAKTESELEAVNARLDQLRQDKRSYLPEGAPHQKETLDLLLGQDKEYQKLVQRSDALGDQWQQQNDEVLRQQELLQGMAGQPTPELPTEKPKEMAENLDKATEGTKRFDKEVEKAGKSKSTFQKIMSSIKNMFTVTAVLEAIRKSIQWMVAAAKTGLTNLAQHNAGFAATMDAAASKVLQLKNALGTALAPILQAVAPLFNFLVDAAISAANAIAAFVSKLTGKGTYIRAGKAVDSFADKLGGATQNAKELDKATNTLGLDELNLVSQPEEEKITGGGSGSGGTSTFEEVPINPETAVFVDEMLRKLDPTIQAFGRLGNQLKRLGEFSWQGLQDFYSAFLVPVGDWTLGEGIPRFVDALTQGLAAVDWQNINGSLLGLWEALAPFAVQIGEGLVWFWENALVPLGTWTMNEAVPALLDILAGMLGVLSGVAGALAPAWETLWDVFFEPLRQWRADAAATVLQGVADALERISDWVRENGELVAGIITVFASFAAATSIAGIIKHVGDAVSGVVSFISSFVTNLADLFNENGIVGIISKAAGAINPWVIAIGAIIAAIALLILHWDDVKAAFATAGEWFAGIWETIGGAFTAFYETVLKPVFDGILETLAWLWEGYLKPLWDNLVLLFQTVGEMLIALWENILLPACTAIGEALIMFWENVLLPLANFFVNVFGPTISAVVDYVVSIFANSYAVISTIITAVIQIFTGVIGFFKNIFAGDWAAAWEAITGVFSNVWETLKNGFVGIINRIIGALNGLIKGVESGLNYILSGVRAVFGFIQGIIDGASGLLAKVGIDVHFNMPSIQDVHFGQIPTLAAGAVLTRRTVFEGGEYPGAHDNPEIVSPRSMMVSAFREALAEQGGAGGNDIQQPVELSLDGDVFYRAMVRIKANRGAAVSSTFAEAY